MRGNMKRGMEIEDRLLLRPEDFEPSFKGWKIEGVLNPGAERMKDGRIILYVRVAESALGHKADKKNYFCPIMSSKKEYRMQYLKIRKKDVIKKGKWGEMYLRDGTCRLPHISHFKRVILSRDGFGIEKIEQKPAFTGIPGEGEYGVEDPRIVRIGKKYYMTYVGVSSNEGVSSYLAESKDLIKWKRLGLIFREQNKDVALFPEKVRGHYVAFNRPESLFEFGKPSIWISYSKDLIFWGKDKNLMRPREGSWEEERLGAGAPPIKTKKGWLAIYHGVQGKDNERTYSAGAVLLDKKNPEKILARSPKNKPLIRPNKKYEQTGYLNNVVFPTDAVLTEDGKELLIYSGGADSIVSVRKIALKDIWKHLRV
jgi:beta-1,2-mannobiose phosphorylase / 1,2-beta-oligomannan phosphorylase